MAENTLRKKGIGAVLLLQHSWLRSNRKKWEYKRQISTNGHCFMINLQWKIERPLMWFRPSRRNTNKAKVIFIKRVRWRLSLTKVSLILNRRSFSSLIILIKLRKVVTLAQTWWVTLWIRSWVATLDPCTNIGPNQFYKIPNRLSSYSTRMKNQANKMSTLSLIMLFKITVFRKYPRGSPCLRVGGVCGPKPAQAFVSVTW